MLALPFCLLHNLYWLYFNDHSGWKLLFYLKETVQMNCLEVHKQESQTKTLSHHYHANEMHNLWWIRSMTVWVSNLLSDNKLHCTLRSSLKETETQSRSFDHHHSHTHTHFNEFLSHYYIGYQFLNYCSVLLFLEEIQRFLQMFYLFCQSRNFSHSNNVSSLSQMKMDNTIDFHIMSYITSVLIL